MAIKLYSKKDCKGDVTVINSDDEKIPWASKLGSTASVELTAASDRVLLFKKNKWNGDVLYLHGKQTVKNIGDEDDGGKNGFRNNVDSIRVTNFTVRVKIHIITNSAGDIPHGHTKEAIEVLLGKSLILASDIWEKAFITLENAGFVYTVNNTLFNAMCNQEMIQTEFPDLDEGFAHVFVTNTLNKLGCASLRKVTPGFFLAIPDGQTIRELARTLAHEIGHSLGLGHGREHDPDKNKLMTQTGDSAPVFGTTIGDVQVEKVHEGLSNMSGKNAAYRQE